MKKNHDVAIIDRAIEINTRDKIDEFFEDPEKFLREHGALDGLPEFNGFVDTDGNKLDMDSFRRQKSGVTTLGFKHYGIPYDYPQYCVWVAW